MNQKHGNLNIFKPNEGQSRPSKCYNAKLIKNAKLTFVIDLPFLKSKFIVIDCIGTQVETSTLFQNIKILNETKRHGRYSRNYRTG